MAEISASTFEVFAFNRLYSLRIGDFGVSFVAMMAARNAAIKAGDYHLHTSEVLKRLDPHWAMHDAHGFVARRELPYNIALQTLGHML